MTPYELTNEQRKYFGLNAVADNWHRQSLSDKITVYYNDDRIVKILNYDYGYLEYDTDINTRQRHILLPKTTRGKEQKLTIPRVLKIKGSGIQFSGSFLGGGMNVYDNRRNLFFIGNFGEDKEIKNYEDIDDWISNYIANIAPDYFAWLTDQVSQKRLKVNAKAGDIIAYKLKTEEFGFARILVDVYTEIKKDVNGRQDLFWAHPRSLIVAVYAFYSKTLAIDVDDLISKPTLPTICIFDLAVFRGEMPLVGHSPLTEKDKTIPFPESKVTSVTIFYAKVDIESFISKNIISNH